MSVKGINVVFVYVNDMGRAREFYEGLLALGEPCTVTPDWVEYALPGAHLALHRSPARATPTNLPQAGGVRFCLDVDDIQAATAKITQQGLRIHFGPKAEHGYHLIEFQDLDGNPVRLRQKLS